MDVSKVLSLVGVFRDWEMIIDWAQEVVFGLALPTLFKSVITK